MSAERHRSIIATPDGKVFINPTGNAGMATGGTGDVLTGTIAAWLGQLLDAEAACKLGTYLHGMAGDLAEADEGEVAMTASDVLTHLGDAVLELTARRRVEIRREPPAAPAPDLPDRDNIRSALARSAEARREPCAINRKCTKQSLLQRRTGP
jgi:hypothetical protein